jgi:hypothetical protein
MGYSVVAEPLTVWCMGICEILLLPCALRGTPERYVFFFRQPKILRGWTRWPIKNNPKLGCSVGAEPPKNPGRT